MLPPPKTNTEATTDNFRISWIDNAKAIGIILVVLVHSHIAYSAAAADTPLTKGLHIILSLASASYLPLFYFVSGYTYKDKNGTLKSRFRKLIVPYAAYGISIVLIFCLMRMIQGQTVGVVSLLQELGGLLYSRGRLISHCDLFAIDGLSYFRIMPEGAGPMWFLTSLFTSYVLFIPLYRAKESRKHVYIIVYILATYVLNFLPILLPWSLDLAPLGAILIYAGCWCKEKGLLTQPGRISVILMLLLVPIYWNLFLANGTNHLYMRYYGKDFLWSPILCLEIGLIGSILYCICARYVEWLRLSFLLSAIGKASLAILCTHMVIFIAWRHFTEAFNSQVILYLEVPIALFAGILLHRIIYRKKKGRDNTSIIT